jgi:transcriptional regulator with XRE-family HTH domain
VEDSDRRDELKRFLRTRRERLRPADVNLPAGARRRTPGLRREEVAELAGVGVAWYSWLEMGREIRVSSKMLQGIARALMLNDDETSYLFTLAGNTLPKPERGFGETVPPWMDEVLGRFNGPAYFVGKRLDVLAWNAQAGRLFNYYESLDPLQTNIAWRMCMDPAKRRLHVNWRRDAADAVATLRAHHVHFLGNPHFETLIAALLRASEDFRSIWTEQSVKSRVKFDIRLDVPEVGEFDIELVNFPLATDPMQYMAVGCTKATGATARRLKRYLDRPRGTDDENSLSYDA